MSAKDRSHETLHCHAPMPYKVVLRVTLSDDAPPERVVSQQVAYSAWEAVQQAIWLHSGTLSSMETAASRITVEGIEPDFAAYLRMAVAKAWSGGA